MDAKPYGLLHDAHEAYIGDMTRPVSKFLKSKFGCHVLSGLKKSIDAAIYNAFNLEYPIHPNIRKLVEEADEVALATEKRDILQNHDWDWSKVPGGGDLPNPANFQTRAWGPQLSREKFLSAFENLCSLNFNMRFAHEEKLKGKHYA